MRIEPAPYVFRNEDRRQRFDDRRTSETEQRTQETARQTRAIHAAPKWFASTFGAHLLGQVQALPSRVPAAQVRRAYAQPEERTPLRPGTNTCA